MKSFKPEQTKNSLAVPSINMYFLVALRIFIGWHFLYEGITKLLDSTWTSAGYLKGSSWIFSELFHGIADNPSVLQVVDFLNIWGLILIGIGLFFGLFTNIALISGIVLLGLYYIARPPFIETRTGIFTEGNYLFVDRNLIELTALIVLKLFRTSRFIGLDHYLPRLWKKNIKSEIVEKKLSTIIESSGKGILTSALKRREMLKQLAVIPLFGAFVYALYKKQRWQKAEVKQRKVYSKENKMSYGTICGLKISRLILGSNPVGAHARDLMYAETLGKIYGTREKMMDTYELAESLGINIVLQGEQYLVREYNTKRGGNMRTIQPIEILKEDNKNSIRDKLTEAMKNDVAAAFYIYGDRADYLVRANRMDLVGTSLEVAKELGIILGLAGHSIQVPIQCLKLGIQPDFFVKTIHHDNYWSATPKENRVDFCWYGYEGGVIDMLSGNTGDHNRFHDNIWCLNAQETIEVMQKINVPWIGYKVLAAGAISPASGFKFAFESGADHIAVGMADFQIEENVKTFNSLFVREIKRNRPWINGWTGV